MNTYEKVKVIKNYLNSHPVLVKDTQRRIFYVDVGNMPKAKAEQYLRDMMAKYKNKNTTEKIFSCGWDNLCDLYMNNNLSYEFRVEMEKEINSIYDMICDANEVKKEIRIPALHTKGTLHRCYLPSTKEYPPSTKYFLRVNDTTSEEGFTDYDVTHYDLEIMILDDSAEFVQNEKGNFLDYSEEALRPA